MKLTLRPDVQRYIDEQVQIGHFATPEAVVEAAIIDMRKSNPMESNDGIVGEMTAAEQQSAIDDARSQLDRGEGIPFEEVRAYWNKRLHGG